MLRGFGCGAGEIPFRAGVGFTMLDWEDEGHGTEAAVPVPPRAPGMH